MSIMKVVDTTNPYNYTGEIQKGVIPQPKDGITPAATTPAASQLSGVPVSGFTMPVVSTNTTSFSFEDTLTKAKAVLDGTSVSTPQTVSAANLGTVKSYAQIFNEAAATYGVDVKLLTAMAKQESDFNPNSKSASGAVGIMQLMPSTATDLGVTNPYDAYENIMGGAKLISQLLHKYDGNTNVALAAYNAGSGNVDKYGGIPPFSGVYNYIEKVTGYMSAGVELPNTPYIDPNASDEQLKADLQTLLASV